MRNGRPGQPRGGGIASTGGGLDFPTVEVGVRVALPFGNRTADARSASSVAEGRRLRLRTEQLELAVEADVRNASQAVESARASLEAAVQARTLAEEQYASEQRRFEAGTSTVFLVLQRQTAMIATRTEHARAELELSRSTAGHGRIHELGPGVDAAPQVVKVPETLLAQKILRRGLAADSRTTR